MIRIARHEDVAQIVDVAFASWQEMPFAQRGIQCERAHITEGFTDYVTDDAAGLIVSEENGQINGVMLFCVPAHYMFKSYRNAYEMMWHASPSLPTFKRARIMTELLEFGEKLAKQKGAAWLYLSADFNTTAANYLGRQGYGQHSTTYGKEL